MCYFDLFTFVLFLINKTVPIILLISNTEIIWNHVACAKTTIYTILRKKRQRREAVTEQRGKRI